MEVELRTTKKNDEAWIYDIPGNLNLLSASKQDKTRNRFAEWLKKHGIKYRLLGCVNENNGYYLCLFSFRGIAWVCCGCRLFTYEEARIHWSARLDSREREDRNRALLIYRHLNTTKTLEWIRKNKLSRSFKDDPRRQ